MSKGVTAETRDLKKLLDNPKIIFVLGGPASGKGTQCDRIVQEFGFSHISTGDLMRAETAKNSKLGEQIKKIQKEGKLVPFEITVQVLINGLIATPSKTGTYLIDGFPRALDQANYFEKNVIEAHQILFYDVPKEKMLERCMKRAETSGRSDDNEVTIQKRVDTYFAQTVPVVDYYKQFGKVHHIDATGSIDLVYAQSKKAILPQCMFTVGPFAAGKTTVSQKIAKKTNACHLDFCNYIEENALQEQSDEIKIQNFIHYLARHRSKRFIFESFPENKDQAVYFMRNAVMPSHVFSLQCPKDTCQQRMISIGEKEENYIPSAILAQKIKQFNMESVEIISFLKAETNLMEVNSDQPLQKILDSIQSKIEPVVIHIRPNASFTELQNQIINNLCDKHGFTQLDVQKMQKGEQARGTGLGLKFQEQIHTYPQNDLLIQMLRQSIYCGQPSLNKFILVNFPDTIDQVKAFEADCSKIAAMIVPTANEFEVEIKQPSHFGLESLFQKSMKLKTIKEWNFKTFQEKMMGRNQFGFLVGKSLVGKSTIAQHMKDKLGFKVIDMKAETAALKKLKGEEFEGEIPVHEVEQAILKQISEAKINSKFIIDDYTHKSEDEFLKFVDKIGVPDFILYLTAKEDVIKARFIKKNEVEGELTEEQQLEIKTDSDANRIKRVNIQKKVTKYGDKCQQITHSTDKSLELVKTDIKNQFSPGIIVVKHDHKIPVDSSVANLSLKHNMLYISAFQLIQEQIVNHTEMGDKLQASKHAREVSKAVRESDSINKMQEGTYSPVHFDRKLVYELINQVISDKLTNQKFIILEGLISSGVLAQDDDKMQIREMDEFFALEHYVGNVSGIVSLQNAEEKINADPTSIEYHEFPKPEVVVTEKAKKPEGEGEEEGEAEPAPEEAAVEAAEQKWNPEDFKWTVTNRKSKNLAQLYVKSKGPNGLHEVKQAGEYGHNRLLQTADSIDKFCTKIIQAQGSGKSHYVQVIFK